MNYKNLIENRAHIHFVGVGGVSMNSLAKYLFSRGARVTGSDARMSDASLQLNQLGIKTQLGHKPDYIKTADLVVATGAIADDNPEIVYAKAHGIEVVSRAEMLGEICKDFDKVIAVAGCHGKSTTSAMIYSILRASGASVSCHIGAQTQDARMQYGDEYLVVEACEFKRSFLHIKPYLAVITNVEKDHLDCYKDLTDIQNTFRQFADSAQYVIVGQNPTTEFLGVKKQDYVVQKVYFDSTAQLTEFSIVTDRCVPITISTLGGYNVDNATLSARVAWFLGFSDCAIVNGLRDFKPVARRSQLIGKFNDADVVIDYAHHPTEIRQFYEAMKFVYHEMLFIFQPHTYTRTKALLGDFVETLKTIDNLVIYKEYSARETSSMGVSSKQLVDILKQNGVKAKYAGNKSSLQRLMKKTDYDAILFVGAGDIASIAGEIVGES
ncbi:MAG: UDP-N-acetylmuramate--L-alanine ligase [Clostridia bacterium]|nr:UDP-N-acetylmuramate--L-alanine ligase [Clostridia bacterium]